MTELYMLKDGTLCFDEGAERCVKMLQKMVAPDDIYLFLLLYMETLDNIMQFVGENDPMIITDMLEDYSDELIAAKHASDVLDIVYCEEFISKIEPYYHREEDDDGEAPG